MAGSDDDSRSAAVGRKRQQTIELTHSWDDGTDKRPRLNAPSHDSDAGDPDGSDFSRRSSKDTGEISSSIDGQHHHSERSPPRYGFTPINAPRTCIRQTSSPHEQPRPEIISDYDSFSPSDFSIDSRSNESELSDDVPTDMLSDDEDESTLPGVRLEELSPEDQDLQHEIFNITDPKALIRCRCCAGKGHIADHCPERTCEHCGARDQHASKFCHIWRKCTRCRMRGHDAIDCMDFSHRALGGFDDYCDICGHTDHVEEVCPQIANIYYRERIKSSKRISGRLMKLCYECGRASDRAIGHWGDDCPYRDRNQPEQPKGTWSRTHMDKYLITKTKPVDQSEPAQNIESGLRRAAMFDDARD